MSCDVPMCPVMYPICHVMYPMCHAYNCLLIISDEADHINIAEHPKDLHARVNETITLKCQAHNKSGKELVYQWFKYNKKGTTRV